ncbi:hypothetical protein ZHAS_00010092 [Anopheles sinensis]|uniref:Uncharacterized protein n=1 Tax=Anopheles sinensis TaxID=74873 RepID=A0A084VWQ4_ANOSI|nr:hypothetical protein ZHAS_00010092 [Anopheles sinensis]
MISITITNVLPISTATRLARILTLKSTIPSAPYGSNARSGKGEMVRYFKNVSLPQQWDVVDAYNRLGRSDSSNFPICTDLNKNPCQTNCVDRNGQRVLRVGDRGWLLLLEVKLECFSAVAKNGHGFAGRCRQPPSSSGRYDAT